LRNRLFSNGVFLNVLITDLLSHFLYIHYTTYWIIVNLKLAYISICLYYLILPIFGQFIPSLFPTPYNTAY
jgi:hypothetical protein